MEAQWRALLREKKQWFDADEVEAAQMRIFVHQKRRAAEGGAFLTDVEKAAFSLIALIDGAEVLVAAPADALLKAPADVPLKAPAEAPLKAPAEAPLKAIAEATPP